MKRKDMNCKDKTAQMIGLVIQPRVIQPAGKHASVPMTTDVIEPAVVSPAKGSNQKTLLHTTLSRELGLNLGMPMVGQGADISLDFDGLDFDASFNADFSPEANGSFDGSWDALPNLQGPRYRITKLLSQSIGKRTFLGIEDCSQSQVVIQLLLFCPDVAEEEAFLSEQQDVLPPYTLPVHLPYIESFEASTPLGDGLVLIKSSAEEVPLLSTPSATPSSASGLPAGVSASPSRQSHRLNDEPAPQQPPLRLQSHVSSSVAIPTIHPQHAYGVMRIRITPQKLQVQFPERYVCSGLLTSRDGSKTATELVEMWLLIVLGTVVFVGGIVASTGSVLAGIGVAAVLPIVYRFMVGAPPTQRRRIANLRITSEPDGRAFISLTSMGRPIRDRTGHVNGPPTESQLHGSRLSIKSVKVSPALVFSSDINPFKAKLSFSFHNKNWHSQTLSIVGSYAEIRWLSHHLAEWGRARSSQ